MNINWISETFNPGLVSVIIPTFNRALYLTEAIESVIAQNYRPIECIIVDDGSEDNTKEIINQFLHRKEFGFLIKYFYQNNAGSQMARNKGTIESTGEFIQYLDSDDLLYPLKIQTQVNYLLAHPECDAVFGDWRVGLPENNTLVKAYAKENLIEQMLTGRCIHTLSILMRRSAVQKIGEWDVSVKRNQEIDYHLRGIIEGCIFHYQMGECGLWRTHQNERIANKTNLNDTLYFFRKWEKILIEKNKFTIQLAKKISEIYMWLIQQNINKPNNYLIPILRETIRLNPEIPFYNTKIKICKPLIGLDNVLRIWLLKFKLVHRVK